MRYARLIGLLALMASTAFGQGVPFPGPAVGVYVSVPMYTLTITPAGTGTGTISSSPSGILCGATCSYSFVSGTVVTLTATPSSNSSFTAYSGDCTGLSPCDVTMGAAKAVTATFDLIPTYSLLNHASVNTASNPASTGAFANPLSNGSCIVVGVQMTAVSIPTPTDTATNTYTDCGAGLLHFDAGARSGECFKTPNTHSTANNVVSVANAGGVYTRVLASEWSGPNGTCEVDVYSFTSNGTSGSGINNASAGTVTTTNGDLIWVAGGANNGAMTAGTNFTALNPGFPMVLDEYTIQSVAGPITGYLTDSSVGESYWAALVAFLPGSGLTTVATPTISPAADTYSNSVTFTLTPATAGAASCVRTDGVAPTAGTPGTCDSPAVTYSTPITLTSTSTVKYIGTKSGMTNSPVGTTVYTITTGSMDGPAILPLITINTTYPTTSGYVVKTVCASTCDYTTLQLALNNIHIDGGDVNGEIIELASGVTFTANNTLPAYTMTAGKWIIVTTDPAAYTPPAPGTRVESANFTGMALIVTNNSSPAIQTASQANHYWFMGVEIGVANPTSITYNLFAIGNGETVLGNLPNNITIDRCYLTGNVAGANANNVARGVEANGNYIAVINSYIDNIHQVGSDAQAIASWSGGGPFEINNNFLEGSTENILFGGADPSIANLVPSDITITQNHFFKPLTWKYGDPSYGGVLWQVKNLLELKNAQRVLVEGNVLENNWAQAQNGYGVLFTPRNQSGTCTWCGVSNVTFRYNLFQHSGSGFNMSGADAASPCGDGAGVSLTLNDVSMHDNLVLDINGTNWGGADGTPFQILSGNYAGSCTVQGPQNLTINHNTAIAVGRKLINTGDYIAAPTIGGFVFENGIQARENYGVQGSSEAEGSGTLNAYFGTYTFTHNAIENAGGNPGGYPSGNFWPTSWSIVDFVDSTLCPAGQGFPITNPVGDCALQSGSPYHNAGTDGADLGANMTTLASEIAGVIPAGEP